jgi:hypothetical protein
VLATISKIFTNSAMSRPCVYIDKYGKRCKKPKHDEGLCRMHLKRKRSKIEKKLKEKREALRNKRYWLKFLAAQKAKNKALKNGHSVESDESHEAEESSEEESEEESRGGEDNNMEVDLG